MNIDEIKRLLGEGKGTEAQELFNSLYAKDKNRLAELIIKSHDITLLNLIVDKGLDIEYNMTGYSPENLLHLAVRYGNAEMVDFLISKGANVNSLNDTRSTPLLYAAIDGSLDIVKLLISKGADVNRAVDCMGRRPLHEAANSGYFEVAKVLISKGADVNSLDEYGDTPLHLAAMSRSLDTVKLLISKGADVNSVNEDGETPLHAAVLEHSLDKVKLLISKGADVNCVNRRGQTLIHYAAWCNSLDIVKLLISNGTDVNCVSRRGETLLDFALTQGKLQLLKLLLEYGCDVPDSSLTSPIIISSLNELVGSIDSGIFEKDVFTKEDIISLKFLRKYATREDVKAKFGVLPAEHPIYEMLDPLGNVHVLDSEEIAFISLNKENPYMAKIAGACGWSIEMDIINDNYDNIMAYVRNPEITAVEKDKIQNTCKNLLKTEYYPHGKLVYNAALILSELDKKSDRLSQIDAIKYLIEAGHGEYVFEKLQTKEINIEHVMNAVSFFYAQQPCYQAHETYEKIAPIAEYLISKINPLYNDEIKYILAAYLLHNQNYELVEEFVEKGLLDLNSSSKQMTLLSKMAMEKGTWAVQFLLEQGARLFNPEDKDDNPIIASALVGSKDILELIMNQFGEERFQAVLKDLDLSGSELAEYASSLKETNHTLKSDVISYIEYLVELGLIKDEECHDMIVALPDDIAEPMEVALAGVGFGGASAGAAAGAGAGSSA